VIGVAAGTVLVPEMTRRIASGDAIGAARAQNRSIALSLALSAPFLVGFLLIPDLIIGGVYQRGAFDAAAVLRSSQVLEAYGFGLIPMVLIRSAVAAFVSRGDTRTPMFCFYGGFLINLALKIVLSGPLGPVGLAIATAAGAWINFGLLIGVARLWRYSIPDDKLYENIALMLFAAAGAALSVPPSLAGFGALAGELPWLRKEFVLAATFAALSLVYLALYAGAARLFGRTFRRQLT
jgi:putative peptidoglycan lipid II flippase